jgi:hypothetical protein
MDSRDGFIKEFDGLLKIPRDYSLEQWQYVYKHVVFSMGKMILDEFPQDLFGPDPFNGGGTHSSGGTTSPGKGKHPEKEGSGPGPGGGGHPYSIIVCIVNGVLQMVATSDGRPKKPKG